MLLETLDLKNAAYIDDELMECRALYKGGEAFKSKINRFLPQNPAELNEIYNQRCRDSYYRSYVGPIVDYYVSYLFSGSFAVRAKDAGTGQQIETPQVYAEFYEDVGSDVGLDEFMRDRFCDALTVQKSFWLIEFASDGGADPESRLEYEARGLNRAKLIPLNRENIYDWAINDDGAYEWVTIHDLAVGRSSPSDPKPMWTETWCVYDAAMCTVYQVKYEKNKRPVKTEEIPMIAQYPHRFLEVPLVEMDVTDGMWVGGRTRAAQIEHFRMSSALSWSIRRTCYAMPILNLEDTEKPPTMGAGYYIALGKEEKFGWTTPSSTPFDIIGKEVDSQRDEIYRICHQMALGLDNNADTVGRSADSKDMDNAATRVMLNAYGSAVSRAVEETYEILSDALGDEAIYWSVEGFSGYDTAKAPQLLATAIEAQKLQIPSKTFRRELKVKTALAMLPEVDQHVKDAIRQEIASAIERMEEIEEMALPAMGEAKIAPRAPDGSEIQKTPANAGSVGKNPKKAPKAS